MLGDAYLELLTYHPSRHSSAQSLHHCYDGINPVTDIDQEQIRLHSNLRLRAFFSCTPRAVHAFVQVLCDILQALPSCLWGDFQLLVLSQIMPSSSLSFHPSKPMGAHYPQRKEEIEKDLQMMQA